MAITPIDIQHIVFKTAFRGYSRGQVDGVMREMADALDAALKEKRELQRKIESMEDEVERVRRMESAISEALTFAQKNADETRVSAHKQAEMILAEAEQARVKMTVEAQKEIERYRADVALIEATRERFESEFRAMLSVYQEWLERRKNQDTVRTEVA